MGSTEPTAPASLGSWLEREGAASEDQVLQNQEQAFVPRVGPERGDRAGGLRQGCPSCPVASGPGTGMPWEEGPPVRAPATWACCWSHWAAGRWCPDPGWGSQPVILLCAHPLPLGPVVARFGVGAQQGGARSPWSPSHLCRGLPSPQTTLSNWPSCQPQSPPLVSASHLFPGKRLPQS